MKQIEFIKLTETAKLPTRASELSSGFDFYADNFKCYYEGSAKFELDKNTEEVSLGSFDRVLIGTGLAVNLESSEELQIRPRSGLALKEGITVLNTPGTVDEDYKNEIGIILVNTSPDSVVIKLGERIAQGVIMKVERKEPILGVELTGEDRGGGFGHSGKE